MAEKLNQRDRARMMCGVYELLMRLKVFSPAAEVGEMWRQCHRLSICLIQITVRRAGLSNGAMLMRGKVFSPLKSSSVSAARLLMRLWQRPALKFIAKKILLRGGLKHLWRGKRSLTLFKGGFEAVQCNFIQPINQWGVKRGG